MAGGDNWETIETTIVYNGSQQSYKAATATAATAASTPHVMDSIEIITDEGTFDQFWYGTYSQLC